VWHQGRCQPAATTTALYSCCLLKLPAHAAVLLDSCFTACPNDIPTILIDVRPHKEFKHSHIAGAFCVRLSSNGAVLAVRRAASFAATHTTCKHMQRHLRRRLCRRAPLASARPCSTATGLCGGGGAVRAS
jgi:hypothetical protein